MYTREIRDLCAALIVAILMISGAVYAAALVGQHQSSRLIVTLTPQAIGNNIGREELLIMNDSNSSGAVYCGYDSATLSQTPGPGSGARYAPGAGRISCKYPDQVLYCISPGAVVSFDEAYVRTATSTATRTATPTPP